MIPRPSGDESDSSSRSASTKGSPAAAWMSAFSRNQRKGARIGSWKMLSISEACRRSPKPAYWISVGVLCIRHPEWSRVYSDAHHSISGSRVREAQYIGDGARACLQHQQAIDTERDTGTGRQAMFQRGEQTRVDRILGLAARAAQRLVLVETLLLFGGVNELI